MFQCLLVVTTNVKANKQFDQIDLTDKPNRTLTGLPFLEFKQFEVINTTAAVEKGFLAKEDMDCAVSKPNTLHQMMGLHPTPSIIQANATALAEHNLSEYFDIIGFAFKPLGPVPDYSSISVEVWRIEGKVPTLVDSMAAGWFQQKGFLPPITLFPSEYWPGWGQKVNWVQIEAQTETGEPLEFCVDNLVLRFHKNDEDEDDSNGQILEM